MLLTEKCEGQSDASTRGVDVIENPFGMARILVHFVQPLAIRVQLGGQAEGEVAQVAPHGREAEGAQIALEDPTGVLVAEEGEVAVGQGLQGILEARLLLGLVVVEAAAEGRDDRPGRGAGQEEGEHDGRGGSTDTF